MAFRGRAVAAYEAGEGGYHELAALFGLGYRTLQRWVAQYRATEACGATLQFLPPYSYDFNPIESAWGLIKKRIRKHGSRTAIALRRTAQTARHMVRPHHCREWFRHAGYVNSSGHRG
jgi:hypothetical protein